MPQIRDKHQVINKTMWVDISQCGFPDWVRIWLAECGYGAINQSLVEEVRRALPLLHGLDGPRMMQYFHEGVCFKHNFMYPHDILKWDHPFPFAVEKAPVAFEEPQAAENRGHLRSDRWLPLQDNGSESILLAEGFTHYLAQYESQIRIALEAIINHPDLRPKSGKLVVGIFRGVKYLNEDLCLWRGRFPFTAISPRYLGKRPAGEDIRGDEKRVRTEDQPTCHRVTTDDIWESVLDVKDRPENRHKRLIDTIGRSSVFPDVTIPGIWMSVYEAKDLCPEAVDWAHRNQYHNVCVDCIANINTAFATADQSTDFEAFFRKQINTTMRSSINFSESAKARFEWGMKFPFARTSTAAQGDVAMGGQWNVFRCMDTSLQYSW